MNEGTDTATSPSPHLTPPQAGEAAALSRWRRRLEYALFGSIAASALGIAAAFILFDVGTDDVRRWGYPGLWVISLLRSASVIVPIPGGGLTFAAGAFMEPVFGIPAVIVVGVVAGSAESIGEFTGYAAGRSGSRVLDGRRFYQRVRAWIQRRAFLTMLLMSFTPSPVFDVAGLAAGAAHVPIRVFYPAILIGKIGRGIMMAAAGAAGWEILSRVF